MLQSHLANAVRTRSSDSRRTSDHNAPSLRDRNGKVVSFHLHGGPTSRRGVLERAIVEGLSRTGNPESSPNPGRLMVSGIARGACVLVRGMQAQRRSVPSLRLKRTSSKRRFFTIDAIRGLPLPRVHGTTCCPHMRARSSLASDLDLQRATTLMSAGFARAGF